jgi:O-succinylhomoserine sulfhydrylase
MFLTSSYVFESAAQAASRFSGEKPGMVYSRFTNPTVDAFSARLASLEGAEAGIATASGMAAILTLCLGLLKTGDKVLVSQSVFGSTVQVFTNIFSRFGIEAVFVPLSDLDGWRAAMTPNVRFLYVETPSNPLTEVGDVAALAKIAHDGGALLVVDNCFCTPALQRPIEQGADLVVHSATKYIDGQGRVLGGAIVGSEKLIKDSLLPILRTAGPSLSAFNAWLLLKGLETLSIRMERACQTALTLATWLESHPAIERVYYPGLPSHPQHALAMSQQSLGGAIVSFDVKGGREAAWRLIDSTKLISITANLGDTKSTITHPASTTHGRIPAETRLAAGIKEGLIRVSVGLESAADLQADLARGLA